MTWYKKIKISMPIPSDHLLDVHNKDLRKVINKNTQIIVYHGTSSKKLAQILAHGYLDPKISSTDEYKSYSDSSPGIFVTTDGFSFMGAGLYGWHASSHEEMGDQGDSIILELVVPWNWINPDPDDLKEDLARRQGVINRPISIKRIRSIQIRNLTIAGIIPYSTDDTFDRDATKWMPIGKMMDIISKLIKNGYELPEEYYQMVNNRPKGLSRSEPGEDMEGKLAQGLINIIHQFYSIDSVSYDQALIWVFQNKNNLYGNALDLIKDFIRYIGNNVEDFLESAPEEYLPQQYENFISYVMRVGY